MLKRAGVPIHVLPVLLVLAPIAHAGALEDAIETRAQRLVEEKALTIGSDDIAAVGVLPELYERRGFRPAWNPSRIDALMAAIEGAALDGLDPADYHIAELQRLRESAEEPGELADLDVLATDALVRLAYHLYLGKVDPEKLDAHWN